ncbi:DsbA family protein [Aurantimonas sp. Leaf443]|uniref:DsbA family protein n=1 Tax=Aurantimonas sp. Leaf443 TaxID=1736378 RepID=UPI0006FF9EE4|nr:DsbA family protein [Aurantimonas sp. Leaf443]KQT88090.1 hypothetical protein ASG48_01150 [Aurantimonas sp. Leaf443]
MRQNAIAATPRASFRLTLAALAGASLLALSAPAFAQAETPATGAPATSATTSAPAAAPAADVTVPEPSATVDVAKLMAEQPLKDVVIGNPDAPVTIVEYASMTCSHCATFHEETYPTLKKDYLDTGKAKLILREFPFDPRALAAFMLARCTGDDAKRTAMVDVLFDQQDTWARAENASVALLNIAKLAGMNQEQFAACLNDKDLQSKVVAVQEKGQSEFGVDATPTFFINGQKFAGEMSAAQMGAIIDKAR